MRYDNILGFKLLFDLIPLIGLVPKQADSKVISLTPENLDFFQCMPVFLYVRKSSLGGEDNKLNVCFTEHSLRY